MQRMKRWGGWAVFMLVTGTAAPAVAGPGGQTPAGVWRDPDSGATVRIRPSAPGRTEFDVSDATVTISKRVSGLESRTTVTAGADSVLITLTLNRIVVERGGQRMELTNHDRAAADAIRRWAGDSDALRLGVTLLGRVRLPDDSPIRHALMTTRLMLLSVAGDPSAAAEMARWSRLAANRARLTRVDQGPTTCWNLYAMEAIAAYIEYEQCVDSEQWWDLFGLASCLFIYEMRAIGAFSWWLSCTGLSGFVG